MVSIEENPCICIQCEGTIQFCTSNENEKRRHVAIVHGKETFSSLRCGKCERKYFDMDHFTEHLETSQECHKDSWMIKREPLSAHLEMAFAALVEQMMRPVETDQMEQAPISGGNGEGKMDRTSGETSKRGMDGAKRKRVEGIRESDGPSSTKRQRSSATRTVKAIRKGKRKKNKKASINIGSVRKAGMKKRQQRSNDTNISNGCGTGRATVVVDDPNSTNEQFKIPSSLVRRDYCLELIDQFSIAGKLQCQLCSAECFAIQKYKARQTRTTFLPIQHAWGHLKKPIYRCQTCSITKFTLCAIRHHTKKYHPSSKEGYEESADQYHHEIMDMLGQCYDSHQKRQLQQVETKLAIPVRHYDNSQSPLHNQRLHCVRSLASRYSNQTGIACQLCSKLCTVNGTDSNISIRNHVMVHLNKDIFQCVLCGSDVKAYNSLKTHILKYHELKSMEGAYVDYTDKYHQEFVDMIGKCFDPDSGNGVMKSKKAGSGISRGTSVNGKTTRGTRQHVR